jgi:meiotically up-regulated gene 157 (Mug157) protein
MTYASRRPEPSARRFRSDAVEAEIGRVCRLIRDPELAWLFANCFPNTLDTTVTPGRDAAGRDDTFVITGDIHAMWLRDSTNQVWQYLPLAKADPKLAALLRGVIRRQAACVRLDPYANAFNEDPTEVGHWKDDWTEMKPGLHERKYELDSLCAVLRLSHGYWAATADAAPFDADWAAAVELILDTIVVEQAGSDEQPTSPYHFGRRTGRGTDTQPLSGGRTFPYRRTGMSRSPFRPSDDSCQFPFLVPANAMAVVVLRDVAAMLGAIGSWPALATRAAALSTEIDAGVRAFGVREHPAHGRVFAFEVDGFGSASFMDDANVPSLLSLPYLGYCPPDDPLYQATRKLILSPDNPYYSQGKAISGIGGPHVGPGFVWPIAVTMQALTSHDDDEVLACLRMLKATHAGTGFMHEGVWLDDATNFTRPWFAWANSLFGELVVKVADERPAVLAAV